MFQFLVFIFLGYLGLYLTFSRLLKLVSKKKTLTDEKVEEARNVLFKYLDYIAIAAWVLGLIVLIAPTPTRDITELGVVHATYRFVGDLFPALLLLIVSISVNPAILKFFNLPQTIKNFIEQVASYKDILGILAIVAAILHIIFGSSNIL